MMRSFSDLGAFRRDPLAFMLARGRATERLSPVHVGFAPVYLLADPELIRSTLKADEADIDKGRLIYNLREIIGTSSFTISGEEHRRRRVVIHRTLADGMAGDYVPQISAVIRAWAVEIARQDVVEVPRITARLALRVISTILFGDGALSSGDEAAIVEAVHLIEDDLAEEMFRALPHTPWAHARKKRKLRAARRIMTDVVERTRRRATSISLMRALESLGLDDEVLRDEALLMLLSGHHTSGTAAAWVLYHIATDPNLARRLAQEAASISDAAGELTPLAIRSASLSRAVVQEVLRLYPSTYWMSRELQHDQSVGGVALKRGTSVLISQWHLHRDPRFWRDPERFDLDRAWAANPAYMPFGFGGRACVGLNVAMIELQMIALEFATAFEAEVVSQLPAEAPKPSVTLVPPPIRMTLKARVALAGDLAEEAA